MNTPNNSRSRRTRDKIEQVFMQLLATRELSQIRVSQICKGAGINRTTFYAHYGDVYLLADSIRDKLEQNMAQLYQKEISAGVNTHDYLKLFCHIQQNQQLYTTYFKLGYDNNYKILTYDTQLAKQYFGDRFIEYHMEFFKSGLTRIIKMWLQGGCQETPQQMFEILKAEYQGRTPNQ